MKAPARLVVRGRDLKLQVTQSSRRTLAIEVHPDSDDGARLVVRTPLHLSWCEIQARVLRRASWIARQATHFDAFLPGPQTRQYINGANCRLLGHQLVMRVTRGRLAVRREGAELVVSVPNPRDHETVAAVTTRWYRLQARSEFALRLEQWLKHPLLQPAPELRLQVRHMNHRWGSLSAHSTLTLNVKLMEMPRGCIDYVIAHELCHNWHPDHSNGFWELLANVLPDWPRRKWTLERMVLE